MLHSNYVTLHNRCVMGDLVGCDGMGDAMGDEEVGGWGVGSSRGR